MSATDAANSLAEELAEVIRRAGRKAKTEQELLVAVESALKPVLEELGVPHRPEYEKTLLQGRVDAVYGSVIIEYEAPGKLASVPGRNEAYRQIRQYLREQAEIRAPGRPEEVLPKLAGVVLDGRQIGFVLWRAADVPDADLSPGTDQVPQLSLDVETQLAGRFQQLGPFEVTTEAVVDLLRFLRALSRRPLEAETLAQEFGPDAPTARAVVGALSDVLKAPKSRRTSTLFNEWLRLFGAIYGQEDKVKKSAVTQLARTYGLPDDDIGRMLFSVHTYFALVMKTLASELVALQSGAVIDPFVADLGDLPDEQFDARFEDLESGALFRARGIENFLEGDFLGWYVREWSPRLRDAVRKLVREVRDFEPATASLRPDLTQDLLKELYHRLLPRELRHSLGEYYTPDWLAEHTLEVAEYDGQPGTTMLDPACGSGTFLVAAIRRMKEEATEIGLEDHETAAAVTTGIVGFDLNPLAVIAARTNYLLAAGDLVSAIVPFRIPVYICDSITVAAADARSKEDPSTSSKVLATSVGEFVVPASAAAPDCLPKVMAKLEFCADNDYPSDDFVAEVAPLVPAASAADLDALRALFEKISRLKSEDRDGIWPRLLTNAFAPLFARGQFDHVIGNPPWIKWEELSGEYRRVTMPYWRDYGLFTLTGSAARLGGGKKDLSMLMTQVAAEEYLKPDGRLTFIITQTVLQTSGAGDGFRAFNTGRCALRVRAVEDLASFNPFDGASNWTAIVSVQRGQETQYPVKYTVWNRIPKVRFSHQASRAQVLISTKRSEMFARPVRGASPTSPWLLGQTDALDAARSLSGGSPYRATAGITTWLDGVFQVEVLERRADGLVRVRNYADVGHTPLAVVEAAIEPDLLYPFVPWASVQRWSSKADRYLLVPQDPNTRRPFPLKEMRRRWPHTLAYLKRFEKKLDARSGRRRYFDESDPFYAVYNVSPSSMAPLKVAWRTMGNDMRATIMAESAVSAYLENKPTVFKNTVVSIPVEGLEEAGYLAALLNSTWAGYLLRASNVRGGKSAFATNILDAIRIEPFSKRSGASRELSRLGLDAARHAAANDPLLEVSEALADEAAASLWNISKRQQKAIRSTIEALG